MIIYVMIIDVINTPIASNDKNDGDNENRYKISS